MKDKPISVTLLGNIDYEEWQYLNIGIQDYVIGLTNILPRTR